ncbi:MAG: hypothetical protein LBB79_05520 [Prevotellaceae bacterium]|nr:hypothetical protein [Prevotellaceae bacterium]
MKKLFSLLAASVVAFSVAAQRSEPEDAKQKMVSGSEQLVGENDKKCKPLEQESEEKCKQREQEIKKLCERRDEWRKQVEDWRVKSSELFAEDHWQIEEWRELLEDSDNLFAEKSTPFDKHPQPEEVRAKQGGAPNDSVFKRQHKQRQEQIQAHKVGYFTTQLELTTEEAQAFWPIYNEYWEKRNALFNERNNLLRKVKHDKIDDKKALQMARRLVENTQDDANLMREYHNKLEKILSPQKLLKYYAAEESFRVELINILRKRQKTN